MDVDQDSCIEIADEPHQQQQQQQQQRQQQQRQQLEQNEVVPSTEMSIDDDDDDGGGNELTTTIANTKQTQSADIPSIDVDGDGNAKNQLTRSNSSSNSSVISQSLRSNSTESQSNGADSAVKSESDTESESRLIIQSENETTNDSDAAVVSANSTTSPPTTSAAIKENGGTASPNRSGNKRKASDESVSDVDGSDYSDDDDAFIGFTVTDITHAEDSSKLGNLPVATHKNTNEIKQSEEQLTNDDTMNNTSTSSVQDTPSKPNDRPAHFITTDPRYRKPFKYGWRREFVLRANIDNKTKLENKGEVYYHSPNGKKLRSKAEIQAELKGDQNLDIGDFTFAKESIGMSADQEIVRSAKIQTLPQRKPPPVSMETPEVLGKRIRKPKMPKGASPPPLTLSTSSKSRLSLSGKRQPEREVVEIIQTKSVKLSSKNSRESCSIQCVRAMGMIPQLQCKKCQFMFHPECIGKDVSGRPGNFICEHCVREAAAAAAALAAQAALGAPATSNTILTLTTPTNIIPNDTSLLTRPKESKPNAPNPTTPTNRTGVMSSASKPKGDKILSSTAPAISKANDSDGKTPQSIAIVAGRKYIMVPKTPNKNVNGVETAKSSSEGALPVATGTSTNAFSHASPSTHTLFATEFFNNVSRGYDILFHVFQYLKVQELLRASRVCRMWNHVANNSILWRAVRMKNSQVSDWSGLMTALRRHGTHDLDLRKILIPSSLDWNDFITHIGSVPDLETLHLCRCPTEVATALLETSTNLKSLNALSLVGKIIEFPAQCKLNRLTELRLKSGSSISIGNLVALRNLPALRHLSLTSIKDLDAAKLEPITTLALESLELGECTNLTILFARNILLKLTKLRRLRLENGKEKCATFDILDGLEKLPNIRQLELVNFDIRQGFDTRIAACKQLKRILLIPTYISQSATTNNLVLATIAKLGPHLQSFTWVVTQELIRVTDLYTDECHTDGPKKPSEDKIPVIKPIPMIADTQKSTTSDTSPQLVEILPLNRVDKIVQTNIPSLKLRIVKVPFSATWRQTIGDSV